MEYDVENVDGMVLTLLYLTHFQQEKHFPYQAWKGHDWEALDRLHEKGYIGDPKNNTLIG